jgi:hypothetical protein
LFLRSVRIQLTRSLGHAYQDLVVFRLCKIWVGLEKALFRSSYCRLVMLNSRQVAHDRLVSQLLRNLNTVKRRLGEESRNDFLGVRQELLLVLVRKL